MESPVDGSQDNFLPSQGVFYPNTNKQKDFTESNPLHKNKSSTLHEDNLTKLLNFLWFNTYETGKNTFFSKKPITYTCRQSNNRLKKLHTGFRKVRAFFTQNKYSNYCHLLRKFQKKYDTFRQQQHNTIHYKEIPQNINITQDMVKQISEILEDTKRKQEATDMEDINNLESDTDFYKKKYDEILTVLNKNQNDNHVNESQTAYNNDGRLGGSTHKRRKTKKYLTTSMSSRHKYQSRKRRTQRG